MKNEDQFPTVRFLKCPKCAQIFTASLSGSDHCPKCNSAFDGPEQETVLLVENHNGHVLISIQTSILRIADQQNLKQQVDKIISESPKSIAFEFRSAAYLDSALMNILVRTTHELSQVGAVVYVISSNPQVIDGLNSVNLDQVLKVCTGQAQYQQLISMQ